MPIYDIFETKESEPDQQIAGGRKDRFVSSLTARILFFVLLIGDIAWALYALAMVLILLPFYFVSGGRIDYRFKKNWIALKRSGVCGVSLFVALFSPALGIMVACTYFLMYDKTGIQEVVPQSLQDQFQEFLK